MGNKASIAPADQNPGPVVTQTPTRSAPAPAKAAAPAPAPAAPAKPLPSPIMATPSRAKPSSESSSNPSVKPEVSSPGAEEGNAVVPVQLVSTPVPPARELPARLGKPLAPVDSAMNTPAGSVAAPRGGKAEPLPDIVNLEGVESSPMLVCASCPV